MEITTTLYISLGLFGIGMSGVILNRNPLIFFLSIELLLNAANLLFIGFAKRWGNEIGQIWVFFVLVVAAVEAAVGLALIIHLYRSKKIADIDQFNDLKG